MKLLLQFLSLSLVWCLTTPAHAAHGIALWGELKYKENFHHFEYVNPSAPKGGTLKLSYSATFDSMNPFILKGIPAPGISSFVYQSLMTQSYDEPQSYYPLIASSITLAPDRSYADFTINQKAKWADEKPITVDDVIWSFNTLKEKGHPALKVQYKPITIERRGDHAVRFHSAEKDHRELPLIAASLPILPKHYYCAENKDTDSAAHSASPSRGEATRLSASALSRSGEGALTSGTKPQPTLTQPSPLEGEGFEEAPSKSQSHTCVPFDKTTLTAPLGSGPYKVTAVEPGRSVTLTRIKNYWAENLPSQRGLNNFDTIRYDVYRDDTVALEGLKSHQFDFYEEFIARNWATAYNGPAIKSGQLIKTLIPHKIPRGMQGFMFNTRLDKFSDVRVRQAIGLTLDFQWMNETLFYGAYDRNKSYFNNTEFEAGPLPTAAELKLLEPYRCNGHAFPPRGKDGMRASHALTQPIAHPTPSPNPLPRERAIRAEAPPESCLPDSTFTTEYTVPTTDGSGIARDNLIRAQQLLNDAGWVMKDGIRTNSKTGERLTIEFLMTQKTFERVIGIMRQNLQKLGIDSSFRYVDASQYQQRLDAKQFDIVSIWWNKGLFYPSTEQYIYWHSSQADIKGSQNIGGVKNAAVDSLVEKIQNAQKLEDLRTASRALDRVLLHEYYVMPHWTINAWRVAYWDQFGRPEITPAYNLGIDSWWDKAAAK